MINKYMHLFHRFTSISFWYPNLNVFLLALIYGCQNFFKLNSLKSQIIVFCNDILKRLLNINDIFLNNSCLHFCETVKNLGFTLDTPFPSLYLT